MTSERTGGSRPSLEEFPKEEEEGPPGGRRRVLANTGGPGAEPLVAPPKTVEPAPEVDEEGSSCPICFETSRPLARGALCSHAFCQPCLDALLLGAHLFDPHHHGRSVGVGEDTVDGDSAVRVPTQGPCPLCRQRLSLFELRWVHRPTGAGVDNDTDTDPTRSLLYPTTTPWYETPLAGHVYVTANWMGCSGPQQSATFRDDGRRGVGWGSFHFDTAILHTPTEDNDNGSTGANNEPTEEGTASTGTASPTSWAPPYFNIERAQQYNPHHNRTTPSRLELHNLQWHAPSCTLAATVMLDPLDAATTATASDTEPRDPLQHHEKWEVFLTFSPNFHFVRTGAILKVWKPWGSVDERQKTYPLDGMWKIVPPPPPPPPPPPSSTTTTTPPEPPPPVTIRIVANRFRRIDHETNNHRNHDTLGWVGVDRDRNTATLAVGALQSRRVGRWVGALPLRRVGQMTWDWETHPRGPDTGERVVWRRIAGAEEVEEHPADDDDGTGTEVFEEWVRVARSTDRQPNEVSYLGGDPARIYQRLPPAAMARTPPTYHAGTLVGNIFCQGLMVGLASYHFEAPDRVYISYEHPATSRWPPLDNGVPVPGRVYFQDVSFPNPTTFRGSICWQDDYGTAWQRMSRWDYEMRFDSLYTCIVGGSVRSHALRGGAVEEMSWFGENLVYINAALHGAFRPPTEPEAEASSGGHPNPMTASQELRQRLQAEGASVRTIAAVHGVWTAAQQRTGTANPIDFNL